MNEEEARAIFILAGIAVNKMHRLENKYWPEAYVEERRLSPWWLVSTPYGLIEIGWRKRVISIDWGDTKVREEITRDDVTKNAVLVHAWSYAKAVEYMTNLGALLRRAEEMPDPEEQP